MSVSKSWKFTEFDLDRRSFYESLDANVVVFGLEVCPSSGRKHIQGHVSFKRAYRLSALKKLSNAHWEIARCEDFNYELKGEDVFIKDERKKKGKRGDLDGVLELVANGASIREIAKECPREFIRYHRGIERYLEVAGTNYIAPKYGLGDCCKHLGLTPINAYSTLIVGKSGCGKTQWALSHFEKPLLVSHMDDLLQFSEENDGIVFDDMDFRHIPRSTNIYLLDYDLPRSIHCRYKPAVIPAHTFKIFTANFFPFINDDAINRRLQIVTCNLGGRR